MANENGIRKLQLVLLSARRSVLLNDLHISAFQVEILNALEYADTLQHDSIFERHQQNDHYLNWP